MTSADCPFCAIVAGRLAASIVDADEHTIAFVDLRQFHPGHVLVVPRRHLADIRALEGDEGAAIGAALMAATARLARAVDAAFPSDGLTLWHSAGAGANQEVPHLHIHVHPRHVGDDFLRVYPRVPATPDRATLDELASRIRAKLGA
jgi:histidine triad (HIT) family protein